MFEPPAGVWAAQCPFCGKQVEVPQMRAGSAQPEFRKRVRKGPGWWPVVRSHLPGWTNLALSAVFLMLLTSALIQAWLAAHEKRTSDAFERAVESWNKAIAGGNAAETVKSADRLLLMLKTDSARELAAARGLQETDVATRRKTAARADWERRFEAAIELSPEASFADLSDLFGLAKSDPDLSSQAPLAAEAWAKRRAEVMRTAMAQVAAALEKGESASAWKSLKTAESFLVRTMDQNSAEDPFRAEISQAVERIAGRFGMTFVLSTKATVFVSENAARERVVPILQERMGKMGYLFDDLTDPEFVKRFRQAARFRMEIGVTEKYGKPFEDTPHRTTAIEFDFVLKSAGMNDERRNVVVRTPRIPAKTAIGMSRLQLAKNSDERIERTLQQAAWDSIAGPVSQTVGSFPAPH